MKKCLIVFLASIAIIATSCTSETERFEEPTLTEIQQHYVHTAMELELLDLINSYRVEHGLNTLSIIEHISYKANEHNNFMIETNTVNHVGFEERRHNLEQVLGAVRVGENIAFGYSSPEAALTAWTESEGHKANLDGDYTHFGVSIKKDLEGRKYYTNMFIRK
ncbi:CAP domain-containing protein [Flavobacterium chuncheonense]|uniref:CAP domain-containing protein n=1 Tax=Flavobacterium chuncheonense TaxID=2026653 RepID=A0ABW5YH72_9FLAO